MKKICKIKIFAIWAMFLGCCSCQHETMSRISGDNLVIPMQTREKTNAAYLLIVTLGHDGKNCPGCILSNGKWIHVDCQGHGRACLTSAAVVLNQTGTIVTATTTDTFGLTSEDFFLMPDRSLDYEDDKGNHLFLNIPSQMVYRDTATQQFTFTGLSFSNAAAYSNN